MMAVAAQGRPGHSGLVDSCKSLGVSPNIELSLASFARPARAATAMASGTYLRFGPVGGRLPFPSHLRLESVAGARPAPAGGGQAKSRKMDPR